MISNASAQMLRRMRDKTLVFLRDRRTAYKVAFGGPAGMLVLADLAKFCRANQSVYVEDQRLTDVAIGRHEVWLRIQQHMNMSEEQLLALYNGQPINQTLAQLRDDEDA